ncbi:GFA family protein [Parerythrobacter jejuensis]|uniref:Aldehyde-activating protein n=1 Tax=Parerythrobacter jejuensis TaxID=795812 RepID=A0A845ALF8_9SPHN|nr:GFA family protein [Parerythrobacter jejuensis]MXP30319.1 aldehyde-activating protein [Parerythrobacter jejuensis]MXP33079.1 aldehyde-activating protein [Parerythrobacter jejuensis]
MSEPKTGGCLCGAVRYAISADPAMAVNCHCKNCQRQSGSAFSTIIGIPEAALSIEGEFKTFDDKGESGEAVLRDFCGVCGSPLFSRVAVAPGLIFVKVGTLDDTDDFNPAMHLWTRSKQHWVDLAGATAFETNPS